MLVAFVAAAKTIVSLFDRLSRTLAKTGAAPDTVSKSSTTASYRARLSCCETCAESQLDSAWMPSSLDTPLKVVISNGSALNKSARTAGVLAINTPLEWAERSTHGEKDYRLLSPLSCHPVCGMKSAHLFTTSFLLRNQNRFPGSSFSVANPFVHSDQNHRLRHDLRLSTTALVLRLIPASP
jgi:hypothetical protein